MSRRGILVVVLGCTMGCSRPLEGVPPRLPRATLGTVGDTPGAPAVPWSRKSHEQRLEYMGLVVYPRMRALFQEYDAKDFAQFRCQTCHGEDMEAKRFAMPGPLFALDAEDPVKSAREHDEKITAFMVERVLPALNELLGKDDPQAAARAGCLSCHQSEKR